MAGNPVNHILVYPEDAGYSTNVSTYLNQLKIEASSSYYVHPKATYNKGGCPRHDLQGWECTNGEDSEATMDFILESLVHKFWHQETNLFEFKLETSRSKEHKQSIDTGDCNWMKNNDVIPAFNLPGWGGHGNRGPLSSWLRNVTGLWFLFDGKGTTETRDCYVRVERAALRYLSPMANGDAKHKIFDVTEKLGNYSFNNGIRGNDTRVFGYQLSQALREQVKTEKMAFAGFRLQLSLKRGASGVQTDTIQSHIRALRLSLGDASLGSINRNTRMALAGNSDTGYCDIDLDRFKLETGKT